MPEPLLLDTDIGTDVDDALALVLAANSPEVELASVTTVGGRTGVRAEIARKLLGLAGRGDVPVATGLRTPLKSDRFGDWMADGLWMGHEGQGLLSEEEIEESSQLTTDDEKAAYLQILEKLSAANEPVNIVTIGPCTNLGALFKEYPDRSFKIKQLYAMGGALQPPRVGHSELPWVWEYNFNADREAAATVLEMGFPTTLIPVELTTRTFLTHEDVEELEEGNDAAKALASLLRVWAPIFQSLNVAGGIDESAIEGWVCHLHDPLALVALIKPDLISFSEMRLSVREQDDVLRTVPDPSGPFAFRAAVDADLNAVRSLVVERLKGGSAG